MTVDIRDYRRSISVECPGAPNIVIDDALWRAATEFFSRSRIWRRTLRGIAAPASVAEVSLTASAPVGSRISRPLTVTWVPTAGKAVVLGFKATDQLDTELPIWATHTATDVECWTMDGDDPAVIRLVPIPSAVGTINARVALTLPAATYDIPDTIDEGWRETLMRGTLANLLKIPGKDWSDPRLAGAYGSIFDADILTASSRATADHGRPVRVISYGGI